MGILMLALTDFVIELSTIVAGAILAVAVTTNSVMYYFPHVVGFLASRSSSLCQTIPQRTVQDGLATTR